jgi:hypothetical protein
MNGGTIKFVGLSNRRTIELSDYRTVGLSNRRTIEPSDYRSDPSEYNLRNNENYVLPRCRLRISEKSFIPSTVRIWNDLSPTIRNLQTISQFK